jgi:uncharacterized protein with gpF-like domain
MKDLIDLGNLTFNRLVSNHGEHNDSRLLFLYGVTNQTRWHIANSSKWVLIEKSGLSKNFDDAILDELALAWKQLKAKTETVAAKNRLDMLRAEYDRPAPKPGETFEFGKNSGGFREIPFNF